MIEEFQKLAEEYNLSLNNIILISLNRYGVKIDNFEDSRIRFNLKLPNEEQNYYCAVCVNTYNSPFKLQNNTLYLENQKIGEISKIEKDTCTSTYFRNNKKAITFNSNSRSKCKGCKFCGTYSLTDEDNVDFSKKDNIKNYFRTILQENQISNMGEIEEITICTGCFETEDKLIEHLLLVNSALKEDCFNGKINYIGSQLKDYKKIYNLHNEIKKLGLYLTIEKFVNREEFMRKEKAELTMKKAKDLLSYCSALGIETTFLYILGLEDLKTMEYYFKYLSNSVNKFPIVQVFQNYTTEQENYRCIEAKKIEYYLKARKMIDSLYSNNKKELKLWECYRSLYTEDNNKGENLCRKRI